MPLQAEIDTLFVSTVTATSVAAAVAVAVAAKAEAKQFSQIAE